MAEFKNKVLVAEKREAVRKGLQYLRAEGKLPGVLYADGDVIANIQLAAHETSLVLRGVEVNDELNLELDKKTHKVRIKEMQRHPVRRDLLHLDLQKI